MASPESPDRNQPSREKEQERPQQARRGWFSWWWVWIPIIIVVLFWIAGWGFGNYGGPWSPKPQGHTPKISDPAVMGSSYSGGHRRQGI